MIAIKLTKVSGLALVALLLLNSAVVAQTINPSQAQFTASPDHNAVDATTGAPVVQSYELRFFLLGGLVPFQTNSLGKPNPDATGTITVDLTSLLLGWPVPGLTYITELVAIGPSGTSLSTQSNTFAFASSSCSYSLSASSQSIQTAGGSVATSVTTAAGCNWTAVTNATWISVASGASGSGNGTVTLNVAANTATTTRTGTVTIAGKTFTVVQAAASCTFTLSPTSQTVPASGGAASTALTTTSGCAWTTASSASWITFASSSSGTASGTVTLAVAANTATTSRTGTVTIAGQTFSVTQSGTCAFSLTPTSMSVPANGGSASTSVTGNTGCGWTAASGASWITITSGASGSGSGAVAYAMALNTLRQARTGTLTVAGQTVSVTQEGARGKPSSPKNPRVAN